MLYKNLQISKNTQAILTYDPSLDEEITLNIALIGAIHISALEKEYEKIFILNAIKTLSHTSSILKATIFRKKNEKKNYPHRIRRKIK